MVFDFNFYCVTVKTLYIAVRHNVTPKEFRIGCGNGHVDVFSFPSKANPTTLNFSALSVNYNTPDENNSLVYCNHLVAKHAHKQRTIVCSDEAAFRFNVVVTGKNLV